MAPGTAVILNPRAANGRVGKHIVPITERLRQRIGDYALHVSERPLHATELARRAIQAGATTVVSVGGDGTHNEVANGFFAGKQAINPEACLGIVPYGTGADYSRTLGIQRGMHGLDALPGAVPRTVDVGCVTFALNGGGETVRYFLNVTDFGLGGEVVSRVNATSKFFGGFLSFLYGVVATVATYRNPLVCMQIDGRKVEGRCANVIIAKGQYYGGGMHVAPDARLDSGMFEVYVIGDVGRLEAIRNLPKLYRGRLLKRADIIDYYLAERVVARSPDRVLLNLDGEQPGRLPATVEVLPSALKVLCPPQGREEP